MNKGFLVDALPYQSLVIPKNIITSEYGSVCMNIYWSQRRVMRGAHLTQRRTDEMWTARDTGCKDKIDKTNDKTEQNEMGERMTGQHRTRQQTIRQDSRGQDRSVQNRLENNHEIAGDIRWAFRTCSR